MLHQRGEGTFKPLQKTAEITVISRFDCQEIRGKDDFPVVIQIRELPAIRRLTLREPHSRWDYLNVHLNHATSKDGVVILNGSLKRCHI